MHSKDNHLVITASFFRSINYFLSPCITIEENFIIRPTFIFKFYQVCFAVEWIICYSFTEWSSIVLQNVSLWCFFALIESLLYILYSNIQDKFPSKDFHMLLKFQAWLKIFSVWNWFNNNNKNHSDLFFKSGPEKYEKFRCDWWERGTSCRKT